VRLLLRHPDCPPSPIREIRVDAVRLADGRLSFVYGAAGDIGRARIPAAAASERTDGLWRHTCFEAFVRPADGEAYFEFNFAPSGQWAAYRFDSRRGGRANLPIEAPAVRTAESGESLGLVASVALGALPELLPWGNWRIGLAAVIEASDGGLSYWALRHPPGPPDFHHRDCFAAELPAAKPGPSPRT